MALREFTTDVQNVTKLDDKPQQSSRALKEIFDKAGVDIKEYINKTLVPYINDDIDIDVVNSLTTGGTTKALSAEMGKKLNDTKQATIRYGKQVPTLSEGEIFIQIFD